MRIGRLIAVVAMSAGFGLAVGGCFAFAAALDVRSGEQIWLSGFGHLNGYWTREDFCILAVVLSSVGSAVFVLGLTLVLSPPRAGINRPWRRVVWAALVTIVVG